MSSGLGGPPDDWLVPDWPAPPSVRAVCTTRAGGVSGGPFASLNLGDHVGDDPQAVAANRTRLQAALGVRPVFLSQVHGVDTLRLDAQMADGQTADAALSDRPGVACTVMVADCLPVLFTDRVGSVVAAAHAGWRGLLGGDRPAAGVLEATFEHFCQIASEKRSFSAIKDVAKEMLVWLGPCIGPSAFQVGAEVREAFVAADPAAESAFQDDGPGRYRANLPALAQQRLAALGIGQVWGNDGSAAWCTVGNPLRFFSHRRDGRALGGSGRFAACIWLDRGAAG